MTGSRKAPEVFKPQKPVFRAKVGNRLHAWAMILFIRRNKNEKNEKLAACVEVGDLSWSNFLRVWVTSLYKQGRIFMQWLREA